MIAVDLSSGTSGSSNNTPSMFGNEQISHSGDESDDNADGANSPPMQGKIVIPQTPQHIECNTCLSTTYYLFIHLELTHFTNC